MLGYNPTTMIAVGVGERGGRNLGYLWGIRQNRDVFIICVKK